jgi:hypothetical protein
MHMKKIKQDELFRNFSGFLKSKGVELKDGSYTKRLEKGCALLTDAVNFTQSNLRRVKSKMDVKLDQMRQVIHEKTAPKTPPAKPAGASKDKPASGKAKTKAARKPAARGKKVRS